MLESNNWQLKDGFSFEYFSFRFKLFYDYLFYAVVYEL